jgi:23S rRNA (cytidine1920-2'-O)/16S rRNA (cytidine1409-2'-O)-methyltransferase
MDGRICADLGASTGGFTDCLLRHGAREVHAYDVGRGQLDWSLRSDPRVVVHDQYNVRFISAGDLPPQISLVTADLSFISLSLVLGPIREALLAAPRGPGNLQDRDAVDLVLLVKPQFEVGKGEVGKGGIVRDPAKRLQALESVENRARDLGFRILGSMPSPVAGAKGNQEFLLYLQLVLGLSSRP